MDMLNEYGVITKNDTTQYVADIGKETGRLMWAMVKDNPELSLDDLWILTMYLVDCVGLEMAAVRLQAGVRHRKLTQAKK